MGQKDKHATFSLHFQPQSPLTPCPNGQRRYQAGGGARGGSESSQALTPSAPSPIIHLTNLRQEETNLERINLEAKRTQRVFNLLLQLCNMRLHNACYTIRLLGNGVSTIIGWFCFKSAWTHFPGTTGPGSGLGLPCLNASWEK